MEQIIDFSTESFAPKERFEAWRSFGLQQAGVEAELIAESPAPYHAKSRIRRNGALLSFRNQCSPTGFTRAGAMLDRGFAGCYFIGRDLGGGADFSFSGRSLRTERGSLLIVDADQPFSVRPFEGAHIDLESFIVPKALLKPHLPRLGRPLASILSNRRGLGALAASYYSALEREWEHIPEHSAPLVVDTLCRLVGIACGAAAADHAAAVQEGHLTQARRYIETHLADPDLSPARAAATLRISKRALHAAFEGSGTSFSALVRKRRLEECRASLLAQPGRPVLDIALAWGFGSMPSFYRSFVAEFGMSPGELRAAADCTK
jgi:AraC family transcriptional regulator, positive regulator of tynA and feaB